MLVTIDCDGQHEPQRIAMLVAACRDADIVSGSRYLASSDAKSQAPAERRQINQMITRELNERLGLSLTDAFCGFKAYRVCALSKLHITDPGYAMPLELWVQAAYLGLQIVEVPVPLIYLEEKRSFGGSLDDGAKRMEYYHQVLDRAIAATKTDVLLTAARRAREVRIRTRRARTPPDRQTCRRPLSVLPMLMVDAREYRRFRAPPEDGQTLVEPPRPTLARRDRPESRRARRARLRRPGPFARRARRQRPPRARRSGARIHAPLSRRLRPAP